MEWTALENQIMQNRCKLLEMCFQDSLKKPCRMLTSFAVLSPRSVPTGTDKRERSSSMQSPLKFAMSLATRDLSFALGLR
jgi:hypothetical protein